MGWGWKGLAAERQGLCVSLTDKLMKFLCFLSFCYIKALKRTIKTSIVLVSLYIMLYPCAFIISDFFHIHLIVRFYLYGLQTYYEKNLHSVINDNN